MAMTFQKATKRDSRLRLAITGPSGSGKTYSALRIATGLGKRIAVIDTERGSASKYSDEFEFDAGTLDSYSPEAYVEAIHAAEAAGYDVLIIDSLSHAWVGKDGALEQVDRAAKRSQSGNSFNAWRDVTPRHHAMVDAILQCRVHVIATMRSKTEYIVEQGSNGKTAPRKVGLAPVQRDGMEYEFDVVGDMNLEHEMIITKSRCQALADKIIPKPGVDVAATLAQWLSGDAFPELAEMDALGAQVYAGTWEQKRRELAKAITKGATDDPTKLQRAELLRITEGLRRPKAASAPATDDLLPDELDKYGRTGEEIADQLTDSQPAELNLATPPKRGKLTQAHE